MPCNKIEQMDIHALVIKYCKEHHNETATRVASLILENEEVEYSHRHLRRLVSKQREDAKAFGKTTFDATSDTAVHTYKGNSSITSLTKAIEFFKIDTKVWDVDRYTCNSWDTQGKAEVLTMYQVTVHLVRKPEQVDLKAIKLNLLEKVEPYIVPTAKGKGVGVLVVSDLHIGARVEEIGNTPAFGIKDVVRRLNVLAAMTNEKEYEKVHICLLGDFIESFTGLNHPSTWHELEHDGYGVNVVIGAYEILKKFLTQVNNIESVSIVSGNHDRTSMKMQGDPKGSVAELLSYMLKENTPLNINHSSLLLTLEADSIFYVLTHNHYNISKGDMGKVFWEYGKQGLYNVLLGGHWHARKGKRIYKQVEEKQLDQANYRQIAVAPLFTGNFYSESSGWNSTAGFTLIENNGHGKPNVFEYILP